MRIRIMRERNLIRSTLKLQRIKRTENEAKWKERKRNEKREREMGREIRVRNSRRKNELDNQVSTESSSAHHLTAAVDWVTQFIPK